MNTPAQPAVRTPDCADTAAVAASPLLGCSAPKERPAAPRASALEQAGPAFTEGRAVVTPDETYRFFSFQDVESLVLRQLPAVKAARYDCIVAVARGGVYAATMLSQFTGVELAVSHYSRKDKTVRSLLQQPTQRGNKLLIVEDIAGRGHTLTNTVAHFEKLGWVCDTFTLVWDEASRMRPTYGLRLDAAVAAWPWERGVMTQRFGVDRLHADPDPWVQGFDLDGVFLPDVPAALYQQDLQAALSAREALKPFACVPDNWPKDGSALIISARLASEQAQTQAWLHAHGLAAARVVLRPDLSVSPAQHKAQSIIKHGVCEFVESELEQALEIAKLAPHCVVWHYTVPQGKSAGALYRVN